MHSVKKFIFKSVLFAIPLLLGFILVEFWLRSIPNSYNQKRIYLEQQLDSIEVLILGSSHSVDGINPQYIHPKAFNLGNISQSMYYDKSLTLKYLSRMPR